MKYVYIRQIIIIIGFVVAILGSYFCMKEGYQYSLNSYDKYSNEYTEFYIKGSTGNLDSQAISEFIDVKEEEKKQQNIGKVIQFGGSIICIATGIIIVKKADKILNLIMKNNRTTNTEK